MVYTPKTPPFNLKKTINSDLIKYKNLKSDFYKTIYHTKNH